MTEFPANYGILQLRPLVQPPGAALPTCPVGEDLGTCTDHLDFSSWFGPAAKCPRLPPAVNPPPNIPVRMMYRSGTAEACASLAPASFVVISAASVNTNVQPLNGEPGIEITMPASQVGAYNAAMESSFRRPIAAVADGQIIYLMTIEPNAADYLPMGSLLILYAPSPELRQLELRLSGLDHASP